MMYQAEGGPRFADLFGYSSRRSTRPAQDRIVEDTATRAAVTLQELARE